MAWFPSLRWWQLNMYLQPRSVCLTPDEYKQSLRSISSLAAHRSLRLNTFGTEFVSSYPSCCSLPVSVTGITIPQALTPKTWVPSMTSPFFSPTGSIQYVAKFRQDSLWSSSWMYFLALSLLLLPYSYVANYVLNLYVLNYWVGTSQQKGRWSG